MSPSRANSMVAASNAPSRPLDAETGVMGTDARNMSPSSSVAGLPLYSLEYFWRFRIPLPSSSAYPSCENTPAMLGFFEMGLKLDRVSLPSYIERLAFSVRSSDRPIMSLAGKGLMNSRCIRRFDTSSLTMMPRALMRCPDSMTNLSGRFDSAKSTSLG